MQPLLNMGTGPPVQIHKLPAVAMPRTLSASLDLNSHAYTSNVLAAQIQQVCHRYSGSRKMLFSLVLPSYSLVRSSLCLFSPASAAVKRALRRIRISSFRHSIPSSCTNSAVGFIVAIPRGTPTSSCSQCVAVSRSSLPACSAAHLAPRASQLLPLLLPLPLFLFFPPL